MCVINDKTVSNDNSVKNKEAEKILKDSSLAIEIKRMWCMQDQDFVIFSDESPFHNNGLVNRHNFHYYNNENFQFFRTAHHQQNWSLKKSYTSSYLKIMI